MNGIDLAAEYRAALRTTRPDDLRPLLAAGVSRPTLALVMPAVCRIAVGRDGTYQPDPDAGGIAFIVPVRVDGTTSEAADPLAKMRERATIDLLALHPRQPTRWALRRDVAEWLGAIAPQFLDPPPVPVWRTPLGWLRGGCKGLVILSPEPADAWRILGDCRGGIVAEDAAHAAELRAILARPWPAPLVTIRQESHHAAG